jgi:cyclophilin family peptidyl-prolyl cis-trans isomerase/HEAT repeat protein
MKRTPFLIALILSAIVSFSAQIPTATHIAILKAEDSRDYNGLKPFIFSKDLKIQARAILAAARIGDGSSVDALAGLLENGDPGIRPLAAFALGETEAEHAAVFILRALNDQKANPAVRARAVEAAGKIAAANPKDNDFKALGAAIITALEDEHKKGRDFDRGTAILGLTALLRVRPEGADITAAKFLAVIDPRVRSDAGNTLARLRAKTANVSLRKIALDPDDPARVNAMRALAAAEDKDSFDMFVNALSDKNATVRITAIRALAALKDAKAAEPLIVHGEHVFSKYKAAKKTNFNPNETSEFIEVASALGRLLANTDNQRADKLFADFGKLDKGYSPDVYIARVRVGPKRGDGSAPELVSWQQYSTLAQMVGEFADIEPTSEVGKEMKAEAPGIIRPLAKAFAEADPASEGKRMLAGPDALQAFARFKTDDLGEIGRLALQNKDVYVRATAAGILGGLPASKENVAALKAAFTKALLTDKMENDAQLAILDAAFKLDKKEAVGILLVALNATDYLVRQRAFTMLENEELERDFPGIETSLKNARAKNKDQVLPYAPALGTKLGQVLNTDTDYRRAVARKNGRVKAVFTTEKGNFTIDLFPEDAPLTVDNFIKLANAKYFNGLEVHRVVPNFVMQDGDPRGDGNGGPGWSIRCEVNMLPYNRGSVGMALSGKDTGGSQWFVTHAAQPHLDGGYTVFGRVNETDMKVVDNIVRGDKILTVRIVENRK